MYYEYLSSKDVSVIISPIVTYLTLKTDYLNHDRNHIPLMYCQIFKFYVLEIGIRVIDTRNCCSGKRDVVHGHLVYYISIILLRIIVTHFAQYFTDTCISKTGFRVKCNVLIHSKL